LIKQWKCCIFSKRYSALSRRREDRVCLGSVNSSLREWLWSLVVLLIPFILVQLSCLFIMVFMLYAWIDDTHFITSARSNQVWWFIPNHQIIILPQQHYLSIIIAQLLTRDKEMILGTRLLRKSCWKYEDS
jgi:hypothetical protein